MLGDIVATQGMASFGQWKYRIERQQFWHTGEPNVAVLTRAIVSTVEFVEWREP
jgi:hypothetical protein